MQYPQLRQKIEILEKKHGLDPATIANKIQRDKSTAWRWLHQSADRLPHQDQTLLVAAICDVLKNTGLTDKDFRGSNIKAFCDKAGLTNLEAALHSGFTLPIPDIIANSVFDMSGDASKHIGHYLIFRHDKEKINTGKSYIQACATINTNDHGWLVYEDYWADAGTRISYVGNVYHLGNILNIVGGAQNAGKGIRSEMWWGGLKTASAAPDGSVNALYGYVSDLTYSGVLYTDRILLVRVTQQAWDEAKTQSIFFATREQVAKLAGERLARWLDDWQNIPIDEPTRA